MKRLRTLSIFSILLIIGCVGAGDQKYLNRDASEQIWDTLLQESSKEVSLEQDTQEVDSNQVFHIESNNLQKIKLSKAVNTKQNEYHPVPNNDGSLLYFVGMDRTGQFRAKIDFNVSRGERLHNLIPILNMFLLGA